MARKRSRTKASASNPNTVLVVFLVFFILLSIGLGVWGYFGYKRADEREKARKDEEAKAKQAQTAEKWYKLQAMWARAVAGHKLGEGAEADLKNWMEDFEQNRFPPDNVAPDKAAFQKSVEDDKKNLGGGEKEDPQTKKKTYANFDEATKRFTTSYLAAWANLRDRVKELEGKNKTLSAEKEALLAKDKERAEAHKQAWTKLETEVNKVNQDALDATAAASKEAKLASDAKQEALVAVTNKIKEHQDEMVKLAKDNVKRLKEKDDEIAKLMERKARLEAEMASSGKEEKVGKVQLSDYDVPKGKVVRVDWSGKMPYINLGSADGVKEQLTFSVYGRSADGKVDKTPKGSVEVVKVLGSHLAQARVSYMRDLGADPIQEGDLVYNPAWNPSRKTHVAIAGIVDFSGEESGTLADQVRNLREFLSNLERQNIVVDAYLDLRSNTIKGPGMTLKTDYLILAEGPHYDNIPVLNFKDEKIDARQKTNEMMEKMRKDAVKKGVAIVPLHKFVLMTGYRVPRSYQYRAETETTSGTPELTDAKGTDLDKPKMEDKQPDEKKLGVEKKEEMKKKEDQEKE
jgi:hypothetical protein